MGQCSRAVLSLHLCGSTDLRVAAAAWRREWATARLEKGHYHADHFCYSWHMDLDCKMAAYGIYLGFVIDGDSRMVLHAAVLPDKTACRVCPRGALPTCLPSPCGDSLIS